jgi:hypothetical protein
MMRAYHHSEIKTGLEYRETLRASPYAWRLSCTLIRPDAIPADAAALIRQFETAGPPSEHCKVRPVLRLQRPKG